MAAYVRRPSAWAALAAFTFSLSLGWVEATHQAFGGDSECAPAALAGDHPIVQFEAIKIGAAPTHCAFCHWQRTVGNGRVVARISALFRLHLLDRPAFSPSRVPRPAALDQHATRGPPALL